MAKQTGPTNPVLLELINHLKKKSLEQKASIWKRVALDLEKPTRNRRAVNLSRINRYTKENDIIVVPGKVLSSGNLDHKLTISAFQFSESARTKIAESGATILPLAKLSNESPKSKRIRIIG